MNYLDIWGQGGHRFIWSIGN